MKSILALALALRFILGSTSTHIDSQLLTKVENDELTDIFVTFTPGPQAVMDSISQMTFFTRSEKIHKLRDSLIKFATKSQSSARKIVEEEGPFEFQTIWISNQMYIKAATPKLITKLDALDLEVAAISVERAFDLDKQVGPAGNLQNGKGKIPEGSWGVHKIGADKALRLLRSHHDQDHYPIIVSNIDTGVRHTHEALVQNFIGNYGWFDPYNHTSLPIDLEGHGTHTMGTICGKDIGVYPPAKWMACKGCNETACWEFALLTCAQFILCPTLADGSAPNCSLAPNIVSNSWGGGQADTFFDTSIAAFHIGEIIPVFSLGNDGPSCGTAHSPGDRDGVISVGSTTIRDEISRFSSIGPSIDGKMKPDISAPGSWILSSWNTGNEDYVRLSGTSMACPHVSGAIALLLANKKMSYSEVRKHLFLGAETELGTYGLECGEVRDDVFPNNFFGHGRLDVYQSLKGILHHS